MTSCRSAGPPAATALAGLGNNGGMLSPAPPASGPAHRRRRLPVPAALGLALWLIAAPLQAALQEEVLRVPVQVHNAYGKAVAQDIVVTVFRDDALSGPYPLLLLNHGRAPEAAERAAMGRARYGAVARWFTRLGFLVAVPTRLGYGETGGEDLEDTGSCQRKRYAPGYAAAADQTLQVLDALRRRSDVQPDRAVVAGQSFGGATAVAVAARNPAGVQATLNFAGGGGGNPKTMAMNPCDPAQLQRLFAGYGETARTPSLWVYSENDQFFGPALPPAWFEAFRAAGGVGEFQHFGPNGDDGHSLFTRAPPVWQPRVRAFLQAHGALPPAAPGP